MEGPLPQLGMCSSARKLAWEVGGGRMGMGGNRGVDGWEAECGVVDPDGTSMCQNGTPFPLLSLLGSLPAK